MLNLRVIIGFPVNVKHLNKSTELNTITKSIIIIIVIIIIIIFTFYNPVRALNTIISGSINLSSNVAYPSLEHVGVVQ
jgi:hypothetical protein